MGNSIFTLEYILLLHKGARHYRGGDARESSATTLDVCIYIFKLLLFLPNTFRDCLYRFIMVLVNVHLSIHLKGFVNSMKIGAMIIMALYASTFSFLHNKILERMRMRRRIIPNLRGYLCNIA